MGHPLPCFEEANCFFRAASVHYPLLRRFLSGVYHAIKHHRIAVNFDEALCSGDFTCLMKLGAVTCNTVYTLQGVSVEPSPGLELILKLRHSEHITTLEQEVSDDPEFVCCSCERLFQRKSITRMRNCDIKFMSEAWVESKNHPLQYNENINVESLYVCSYCCPILNRNDILCRCILNGLKTEPNPAELFWMLLANI